MSKRKYDEDYENEDDYSDDNMEDIEDKTESDDSDSDFIVNDREVNHIDNSNKEIMALNKIISDKEIDMNVIIKLNISMEEKAWFLENIKMLQRT